MYEECVFCEGVADFIMIDGGWYTCSECVKDGCWNSTCECPNHNEVANA